MPLDTVALAGVEGVCGKFDKILDAMQDLNRVMLNRFYAPLSDAAWEKFTNFSGAVQILITDTKISPKNVVIVHEAMETTIYKLRVVHATQDRADDMTRTLNHTCDTHTQADTTALHMEVLEVAGSCEKLEAIVDVEP